MYIYARFLRKKKLYYFLKFYNTIIEMIANELIFKFKEYENNNTIPFITIENDLRDNISLNKNIRYTNSYFQINQSSNSYSSLDDNYNYFNNNHIVPIKNKISNQYNLKKIKNNYRNNINDNISNIDVNNKCLDLFQKNISISNRNNNNNNNKQNKKNDKIKKILSHRNFKMKAKKINEECKIFHHKSKISYNLNSINFINNTQSLKGMFPSYTITSINEHTYPIIIKNNNGNYINNNINENNINNKFLYILDDNIITNSNTYRKYRYKPSLCYRNTFTQRNQLTLEQSINSNYHKNYKKIKTQKHLNKSANSNSFQINNNFPDDYLNKQILNFINSNSKTKKDIIKNFNKKEHLNLRRTNRAIKLNKTKTTLNKKKKKINMNKNINLTMRLDEISQFLPDGINFENSNKKMEDQKFEKIPLKYNGFTNNINDILNLSKNKNSIDSINDKLNSKNNKKINLKIQNYKNINNIKSNPYELKIKRKIINNINKGKIYQKNSYVKSNNNINKNYKNNFSNEFKKKLDIIKNNNYINSIENEARKDNITNNMYINNFYNGNEIIKQSQNLYNVNNSNINNINYNFNNIQSLNNKYHKKIMLNKNNNNSNYKNVIYNNINKNKKIIKKLLKQRVNNYFIDKNKNIKYLAKKILNANKRNISQHSISFSTINSNINNKRINPSQYEISYKVVDEQFIKKNNMEEKDEKNNNGNDETYKTSLQSINDSKMLELANLYVNHGKILDKEIINEILTDKSFK